MKRRSLSALTAGVIVAGVFGVTALAGSLGIGTRGAILTIGKSADGRTVLNEAEVGQTFIAHNRHLAAIRVRTTPAKIAGNGQLEVKLYQVESTRGGLELKPVTGLRQTVYLDSLGKRYQSPRNDRNDGWQTVEFDGPGRLVPGRTYYLTVSLLGGEKIAWIKSSGDVYSEGTAYIDRRPSEGDMFLDVISAAPPVEATADMFSLSSYFKPAAPPWIITAAIATLLVLFGWLWVETANS